MTSEKPVNIQIQHQVTSQTEKDKIKNKVYKKNRERDGKKIALHNEFLMPVYL